MVTLKPGIVVPAQETDRENDGTLLSACSAMCRIINFGHNKSLQANKDEISTFTPLQRAFQRKSGNKLARIGALCFIISYAIKICNECINAVRFGDGLFLKEHIDDQQYNTLCIFLNEAKAVIDRKMSDAPKYGNAHRPLIVINKAAVHSAELLYRYTACTTDALFDDSSIQTSSNESTKTNNNINNDQAAKRLGLFDLITFKRYKLLLITIVKESNNKFSKQ